MVRELEISRHTFMPSGCNWRHRSSARLLHTQQHSIFIPKTGCVRQLYTLVLIKALTWSVTETTFIVLNFCQHVAYPKFEISCLSTMNALSLFGDVRSCILALSKNVAYVHCSLYIGRKSKQMFCGFFFITFFMYSKKIQKKFFVLDFFSIYKICSP